MHAYLGNVFPLFYIALDDMYLLFCLCITHSNHGIEIFVFPYEEEIDHSSFFVKYENVTKL